MGRSCRDYKIDDYNPACKNFVLRGGKMFDTTENDFVRCNGLGEKESVKCVRKLTYGGCSYVVIPDNLSCSKLDNELSKNLCYYLAVKCGGQKNAYLCRNITKKQIPPIQIEFMEFIPDRDNYKSDPSSNFVYEEGRGEDGLFNNIYDMCMAFVKYNKWQTE